MKLETNDGTQLLMREVFEGLVGMHVVIHVAGSTIRGILKEFNGGILAIDNESLSDHTTYMHTNHVIAISSDEKPRLK